MAQPLASEIDRIWTSLTPSQKHTVVQLIKELRKE